MLSPAHHHPSSIFAYIHCCGLTADCVRGTAVIRCSLPDQVAVLLLVDAGLQHASPSHDGRMALDEWYSWGSGAAGLLAHGDRHDRSAPALLSAPPFAPTAAASTRPSPVKALACSGVYALIVSDDGGLWECGDAQQSVPSDGETTHSPLLTPSRMSFPHPVRAVACGWSHCVCIGVDGRLWTWGDGRHGQLGIGLTVPSSAPLSSLSFVRQPAHVPLPAAVTAVACGRRHTLALLSDGALWGWGEDRHGQLAARAPLNSSSSSSYSSHRSDALRSPAPIATPPLSLGSYVTAVACGWTFSLLLSSSGEVFACGSNRWRQCAADTPTRSVWQWQAVQGLGSTAQIACGWSHCLARGEDGSVWAWGRRSLGQAGDGRQEDSEGSSAVRRLHLPDGLRATSVCCGSESCMAVDERGALWVWGWNEHGNLGYAEDWPQEQRGCVWTPRRLLVGGSPGQVADVVAGCASVFARVAVPIERRPAAS